MKVKVRNTITLQYCCCCKKDSMKFIDARLKKSKAFGDTAFLDFKCSECGILMHLQKGLGRKHEKV